MSTVLIVEDEPAHAEALRRSLTAVGYAARWADSVAGFRASVAQQVPDLVLADLKLPDGSALDLLDPEWPWPVLVMTSHGDEESAVLAIKRGALDYIVKSISSFAEMPRLVERALREWANVRQRKQAELALQESEARYRLLFETMHQGVVFHDAKGTITSANPAAARILGLSPNQLLGRCPVDPQWHALNDDGTPLPGDKHPASIALRTGKAVVDQLMGVARPDSAERRWILVSATPQFREGESRPYQVFAAFTDISEVRRAQEQRLEMERKLLHVQKLESLGVLAGGVAHDFNNILVAILGHAELALEYLPEGSGARESIEEISRAAHRAADLSRQILAYSGRGKYILEEIQLSELVREMAHLLSASISKKAQLELNLPPDLPALRGDATQIRQITMNLITNASEALDDQPGNIAVTTGQMYCSGSELSRLAPQETLPSGDYVFLEVSDTGCGMSEMTLSRIFEPFFSTKFTGRGLGMASVLGIVRAHHGAITIHSEPGHGSRFRVLFPSGDVSVVPEAKPHPPQPKPGRLSGRVLLVDDEASIRNVGKKLLESIGFQVDTAEDGLEAVRRFAEYRHDCVILDLTMPAMDGSETLRRLQEIDRSVCVLMSSGYAEQELLARCSAQRINGFIQKPYSLEALRKALSTALGA